VIAAVGLGGTTGPGALVGYLPELGMTTDPVEYGILVELLDLCVLELVVECGLSDELLEI
tara:strand:- start:1391 stop:1570 length:180 start_codon:yes stop_codon:yes gene_type:complete